MTGYGVLYVLAMVTGIACGLLILALIEAIRGGDDE